MLKKLKTLRQAKYFTQQDMANKLEISIPAYSKIETGITDISLSRIKQIAEIFNITPSNLVAEDSLRKPDSDEAMCKLCYVPTRIVFNINFKMVPVCEECAKSVFLQQANWYAKK